LKLKYGEPLSNIAFNFDLRLYRVGAGQSERVKIKMRVLVEGVEYDGDGVGTDA
jgi:hypothetical protein